MMDILKEGQPEKVIRVWNKISTTVQKNNNNNKYILLFMKQHIFEF